MNHYIDKSYWYAYHVKPHYYKKPSKIYENKNSNIEYYTDEKGNIKRRKIKWPTSK